MSAKPKTSTSSYQNNPFFVAVDGLKLLFNKAQTLGIILIVLSLFGIGGQTFRTMNDYLYRYSTYNPNDTGSWSDFKNQVSVAKHNLADLGAGQWFILIIALLLFVAIAIFIGTMVRGVLDYTAAELAKGRQVTVGEAIGAVLRRFFPYLWLLILIAVKVFLWSLLLIVPGIIMAVRYSLSGVSFFEEKLGANAATKRSADLTKGAWLTTYASMGLFNVITLGLMSLVLQPGTNGVLYRQYKATEAKPPAHLLSWLMLLIPLTILVISIVLVLVGFAVATSH